MMEIVRQSWAGRKTIMISVAVSFLLGIIVVILSPRVYRSQLTLLVETEGSAVVTAVTRQVANALGISVPLASGPDALSPALYPMIIESTPFLQKVMEQKVTGTKKGVMTVEQFYAENPPRSLKRFLLGYTIGLPGKIAGLFTYSYHLRRQYREHRMN